MEFYWWLVMLAGLIGLFLFIRAFMPEGLKGVKITLSGLNEELNYMIEENRKAAESIRAHFK